MFRARCILAAAIVAVLPMSAGAAEVAPAALNARFSDEALRRVVAALPPDPRNPAPASERANGPDGSWVALASTIRTGRKVVVTLATQERVEGRVRALDAHAIGIDVAGGVRSLAAPDVVSIRAAGVKRRHVRYGLLLGLAVGWMVGWAVHTEDRDSRISGGDQKVAASAKGMLIGLSLGAIVGATLPVGQPLYEATRDETRIER